MSKKEKKTNNSKKELNKKPTKNYQEKLKINASFDEVLGVLDFKQTK